MPRNMTPLPTVFLLWRDYIAIFFRCQYGLKKIYKVHIFFTKFFGDKIAQIPQKADNRKQFCIFSKGFTNRVKCAMMKP